MRSVHWRRKRIVRQVTLLALLAVLSIGAGLNTGGRSEALPPQPGELPVVARRGEVDDLFAEVATRVPAFGGMFLDENGNLDMYLLDPAQKAAAVEAIAAVFAPEQLPLDNVRVLQGQYGFLQLYGWRQLMRPVVLASPGVLSLDIDETGNRLTVGLERLEVAGAVETQLAKLEIPREAVNLEVEEPVEFATHTLQSRIRPVVGGVQISFSSGICTLGFNAILSSVNAQPFVINSHCTTTQGQVDSPTTWYHQPTISGDTNQIGFEALDPAFFTGGACPSGRQCRWSDSALGLYHGSVTWTRGRIARPTAQESITISHTTPTFAIVVETCCPMVGTRLNKVGRTTGWTSGDVDQTCKDNNVTSVRTLLCQDRVKASVDAGDSGSPVFLFNGNSSSWVALYGILWGKQRVCDPFPPFFCSDRFWFSDMDNIEREIGALKTCDPSFSC